LRRCRRGITITDNGNTEEAIMRTRVTAKGQVTIPKRLRDHYGVGPGALVEFEAAAEGGILLKKAGRRGGKSWRQRIEALRRIPTLGLGTEAIMRMTRGDDWSEKPQRRRRAA
jgi:AbrB family looped-hinge helix DNA binding protein